MLALVVPELAIGTVWAQDWWPPTPVVIDENHTLEWVGDPFGSSWPVIVETVPETPARIAFPAVIHGVPQPLVITTDAPSEVRLAEGAPEPPATTESAPKPECDPLDPARCSTPLRTGDSAPYDGQLLSPDLAIDLGQKAEMFELRLGLELERATSALKLDLSLERRLRENDQQAFEAQIDLLTSRLEEAHHRLWWEHPVFVAAVAVVLTGLVFYGSIEGLKALE